MNNEECLICKDKLIYLNNDELMTCSICKNKYYSKTKCINNHYVCDKCHTKSLDIILNICINESSKNPILILRKLMDQEFCHMHGPEHHILVGASLLTAYYNAGGKINLEASLQEIIKRGGQIPGGACGFWGACGATISSGMFISIITSSTPLANREWSMSNMMTSKSLESIALVGGPRCCKRNSYLSILQAIDFVKLNFNIEMEKTDIICNHSNKNNQCISVRCPFYKGEK